ncbi:hypothetical protein Tco_1137027, partial [Tanacetum coccineum]
MEQQLTLLYDIDLMMDDVKVLVRCISIWKSHAKGKPNQPWGLDVVLQDAEGNGPVIMILQLAKVKYFNDKPSVTNSLFATKLFLNEKIPEILALRQ